MIKAVVFDIGGVILDAKELIKDLKKWFKPEDEMKFWEELNIKIAPLCKGHGNLYETMKEFAKEKKVKIPDDVLKTLFVKDFDKTLKFNNDVFDLIKKLKPNYKLGIISNIIEEHSAELKKTNMFDGFDIIILSHEVKMSKHELDIFKLLIKETKLKPEEIVFIDDVQQYADNASSLGIHGICFKTIEQLKKDLVKLNVKF